MQGPSFHRLVEVVMGILDEAQSYRTVSKPFLEHVLLGTIYNFEVVVEKKNGSKLVFS